MINTIIVKQKGFKSKPYPEKNKIPAKAAQSGLGALKVLDAAEKKKANRGHIIKYRKGHEHTTRLPKATEKVKSETIKPRKTPFKLSKKGILVSGTNNPNRRRMPVTRESFLKQKLVAAKRR